MELQEKVRSRIEEIIQNGHELRKCDSYGRALSQTQQQSCQGWIAPAVNAIELLCPNPNNAYRRRVDELKVDTGIYMPLAVGTLTDILIHLLVDVDLGLISSLVDRVRAEAYDDFLGHGEVYYSQGRKQESGVIAGVVFEDTVRRICGKALIHEKNVKLDVLITELAKAELFSQTKAKRARAAAHVRTKATHAQWDEFELSDVKSTIDLTRELLSQYLDV